MGNILKAEPAILPDPRKGQNTLEMVRQPGSYHVPSFELEIRRSQMNTFWSKWELYKTWANELKAMYDLIKSMSQAGASLNKWKRISTNQPMFCSYSPETSNIFAKAIFLFCMQDPEFLVKCYLKLYRLDSCRDQTNGHEA